MEFSIAICRNAGDKWQSKTPFLSIFDPRSSIVDSVFDCRLASVIKNNTVVCTLNGTMLLLFKSGWLVVVGIRL